MLIFSKKHQLTLSLEEIQLKSIDFFDKILSQILSYGPSQTDVNNVSEVRRPPECQLQGHLKWSPSTVPVKTVSVR